jgi:hypothetical protein
LPLLWSLEDVEGAVAPPDPFVPVAPALPLAPLAPVAPVAPLAAVSEPAVSFEESLPPHADNAKAKAAGTNANATARFPLPTITYQQG